MSGRTIQIGKSRIEKAESQIRLLSDITIGSETRTMYFGVEPQYESGLTIGRADPFLAVMINFAMTTQRDIVCEEPVSEKLLFGLRHFYIPTLSFWSKTYSAVAIRAEAASSPVRSQNAVGAAMSFGCDSMYTFYRHGKDSEYPITHLCNFNNGVYSDRKSYLDHSKMVADYAAERFLKSVAVDTNIPEILPESFLCVYSQRNMACVLALQGLFGTYLYASGHSEDQIKIHQENSAHYDPVTTGAFSTDSLQFILSGSEINRVGKLRALCDFEDARKHMHPCFKNPIGTPNCGHCKKDIREMILFYAWGVQKKFEKVYDWTDFEKSLPLKLAVLLSLSDDSLYGDVLQEYLKSGKTIPDISYQRAKQFREATKKQTDWNGSLFQ